MKKILHDVIVGLVITSALSACSRPKPHVVALTWHAPQPQSGVTIVGYDIYRSTTPGGPYVRIATNVKLLNYNDSLVNPGRTYFYVVKSVDQRGRSSRDSNQARADIPP